MFVFHLYSICDLFIYFLVARFSFFLFHCSLCPQGPLSSQHHHKIKNILKNKCGSVFQLLLDYDCIKKCMCIARFCRIKAHLDKPQYTHLCYNFCTSFLLFKAEFEFISVWQFSHYCVALQVMQTLHSAPPNNISFSNTFRKHNC